MLKTRCALCGRVTLDPAVMIGSEPVGPKCARKAGLLKFAKVRGSRVMATTPQPPANRVKRDARTLDLFAAAGVH